MKRILFTSLNILAGTVACAQTSQTLTIQPAGNQGYESVISYPFPTQPGPNPASIVAAEWTGNGNTGPWRTFFKMDLTSLPSNAVVDSAFMSLYADNSSPWGSTGWPTYGTDNAATINRVTGTWDKNTLTWMNQPPFVTSGSATLAQSSGYNQDYININVTGMVQDQLQYGNNGFVIKMAQETTTYNSQIFYSSATQADNRQPSLRIYYHVPVSQSVATTNPWGERLRVYPNPAGAAVSVNIKGLSGELAVSLIDATGRVVLHRSTMAAGILLPTDDLAKGTYYLKIAGGGMSGMVPVTVR